MKSFGKFGTALTGLLVSFGCLAVDPPRWKLETEGAAKGDACHFGDKMASGTEYKLSTVVMHDGEPHCFYEGKNEDRYIKKFGWLQADRDSLREHFTSQQSIKQFIASYEWHTKNKETNARPLPVIDRSDSEISEETVRLVTVEGSDGREYLSLRVLSSASGQERKLASFHKHQTVCEQEEEKLYITMFAGCAWAMTSGQGKADHHDPQPNWSAIFSSKTSSFDDDRNWWTGDRLDFSNCDGGSNFSFMKVEVYASQLPERVRDFYRKRQ